MKITVSVNRKIGQPQFSSIGASCAIEIEIDQAMLGRPAELLSQVHYAGDLAHTAVERELDRQRGQAPSPPPRTVAAEEPLRPGDPAYDRMHPPAPEPARRPLPPAAPQQSQSDRAPAGDDLPIDARQFCGWLNKQSPEARVRVQDLTAEWNLPRLYKTWDFETVKFVVHELTRSPAPAAVPPEPDHEAFMRRHARKKVDEQATAAFSASNGNGQHGANGYSR